MYYDVTYLSLITSIPATFLKIFLIVVLIFSFHHLILNIKTFKTSKSFNDVAAFACRSSPVEID